MPAARGRPARAGRHAEPVPSAPNLLFFAYGAVALPALVLAEAQLSHHQVAALVVFTVCAFAVGMQGRTLPALLAGPMCWMLLNGFVIHRNGELHWDGAADTVRFAALTAAGLAGGGLAVLVSRVRQVMSRHRTVSRHLVIPHRSLDQWEPGLPAPEDTWFWN